jgi:DHA2 family multidrug resistance protein
VALASHLTSANSAMTNLMAQVTQRYLQATGDVNAAHLAALKQLWNLTYREASTLAFADSFFAIMTAFFAASLLVPLLRNTAPARVPVAAH